MLKACHEALPPSPLHPKSGHGAKVELPFGKSNKEGGKAVLEALECIGCLAQAHGAMMEPLLAPFLTHLFHAGLSSTLASTLHSLAQHVPRLFPQLRALLIDSVCLLLTRHTFSEWSSAASIAAAAGHAAHAEQQQQLGGGGGGSAANLSSSSAALDVDDQLTQLSLHVLRLS